jgi:hypothetical protein
VYSSNAVWLLAGAARGGTPERSDGHGQER